MAGDIDVELGRRLRTMRTDRGVAQTALADYLGISFQQVQKYEAGSNRIAVATLIRICQFFSTEPGQFLAGLTGSVERPASSIASEPELLESVLAKIGDVKVRKLIKQLAVALAESDVASASKTAAS